MYRVPTMCPVDWRTDLGSEWRGDGDWRKKNGSVKVTNFYELIIDFNISPYLLYLAFYFF